MLRISSSSSLSTHTLFGVCQRRLHFTSQKRIELNQSRSAGSRNSMQDDETPTTTTTTTTTTTLPPLPFHMLAAGPSKANGGACGNHT
jgi:hypothetical protein